MLYVLCRHLIVFICEAFAINFCCTGIQLPKMSKSKHINQQLTLQRPLTILAIKPYSGNFQHNMVFNGTQTALQNSF